MPKPQPPKRTAAKKTAKKKVAPKKPAAKKTAKKVAKKVATKAAPKAKSNTTTKDKPSAPKKRNRQSGIPLLVEVDLGKLKKLLKDDDSALVTVSRNFVMNEQKRQLEDEAQLKLGI